MRLERNRYAMLTDGDWVERLTAVPLDQQAHSYFFNVKCSEFLQYISAGIFGNGDIGEIVGEFYELLSKDNWHVLRQYKGLNGASLNSYLSRCAVRHFLAQKKKETRNEVVSIEQPEIIRELNNFTTEDERGNPPVWQAFNRLCERDRIVLHRLVIEGMSTIDAADDIWPYVKSSVRNWRLLPVKRVQDTIAMLKRRALFSLSEELTKLIANEL